MTKHPVDVQSGPATHAEPAQTHDPTAHPSEIQHAPLPKPAGDGENQSRVSSAPGEGVIELEEEQEEKHSGTRKKVCKTS